MSQGHYTVDRVGLQRHTDPNHRLDLSSSRVTLAISLHIFWKQGVALAPWFIYCCTLGRPSGLKESSLGNIYDYHHHYYMLIIEKKNQWHMKVKLPKYTHTYVYICFNIYVYTYTYMLYIYIVCVYVYIHIYTWMYTHNRHTLLIVLLLLFL